MTAPPVDGKANAALCGLLARTAGIAPSRVSVVRGLTARDKVVRAKVMELLDNSPFIRKADTLAELAKKIDVDVPTWLPFRNNS